MAVSLVSTGVQFPDASIQTTAAGASAATVVSSINFSGQTSFSFALDFTTYPGGYEVIWCNVMNSSSGNANLMEYSANNGASWAVVTYNYSVSASAASWANNLNYSGYWGYPLNNYGGYGNGNTVVMQIGARNQSSNTSALTMSFVGFGQGSDPKPMWGGTYHYTYGAQAYTNVRFSWSGGNFSAGSVRVLGYK